MLRNRKQASVPALGLPLVENSSVLAFHSCKQVPLCGSMLDCARDCSEDQMVELRNINHGTGRCLTTRDCHRRRTALYYALDLGT